MQLMSTLGVAGGALSPPLLASRWSPAAAMETSVQRCRPVSARMNRCSLTWVPPWVALLLLPEETCDTVARGPVGSALLMHTRPLDKWGSQHSRDPLHHQWEERKGVILPPAPQGHCWGSGSPHLRQGPLSEASVTGSPPSASYGCPHATALGHSPSKLPEHKLSPPSRPCFRGDPC